MPTVVTAQSASDLQVASTCIAIRSLPERQLAVSRSPSVNMSKAWRELTDACNASVKLEVLGAVHELPPCQGWSHGQRWFSRLAIRQV
jgi:hypothetical protein